jgi:hypothetical protein
MAKERQLTLALRRSRALGRVRMQYIGAFEKCPVQKELFTSRFIAFSPADLAYFLQPGGAPHLLPLH